MIVLRNSQLKYRKRLKSGDLRTSWTGALVSPMRYNPSNFISRRFSHLQLKFCASCSLMFFICAASLFLALWCIPCAMRAPSTRQAISILKTTLGFYEAISCRHDAENGVWDVTMSQAAQLFCNGCFQLTVTSGTLDTRGCLLTSADGTVPIASYSVHSWFQVKVMVLCTFPRAVHLLCGESC
jgi:hypothetical protein